MHARRKDLLIAGIIVALCAWAVISQLGSGPDGPEASAKLRTIEVGEALDPDVTLLDVGGERRRVGDGYGTNATVFYSWSTTCPCIPICEELLRQTYARFGPDQGVAWIGVAGEPSDTAGAVRGGMRSLDAFYGMLLDPYHRLSQRLGFDRAAVLAVLDGDGYLRFRGNVSDDLKTPQRNHLLEVLPAIVAGTPPPMAETELAYGCEFTDPQPCPDDEVLTPPPPSTP